MIIKVQKKLKIIRYNKSIRNKLNINITEYIKYNSLNIFNRHASLNIIIDEQFDSLDLSHQNIDNNKIL